MIELFPGQLFTYREENHWWIFRRSGVGQVLATEIETAIVHVSILHLHGTSWLPYILHLPISTRALSDSLIDIVKRTTPLADSMPWIAAWRQRFVGSRAGAFSVPLREARTLVERTIAAAAPPPGQPFRLIDSAFPVPGESGKLSSVHASVSWHESAPLSGLELEDA